MSMGRRQKPKQSTISVGPSGMTHTKEPPEFPRQFMLLRACAKHSELEPKQA